jgi:(1->4)-alpha-D-glucan 1-alpha-D-glucosylmutase
MSGRTSLDRLCALAGVVSSYQDDWKKQRRVPAATRRALLAAMGIDAGTPEATAAAIGELEEAPWRRGVEPALVLDAGAHPLRIPVVVPAESAGNWVDWCLELESGETHEGRFRPADLADSGGAVIDGRRLEHRLLDLPLTLPPGYHRLTIRIPPDDQGARERASVIATPGRCHMPPALEGDGRCWGLAVQLYALRSARNWGIGDFTDLARLVEIGARLGAGAIGISPLHALFPGQPERASPYSGSSRLFLNVLYIDVEAVPEFAGCATARELVGSTRFQKRLRRLREASLVDYAGVAACKFEVFDLLYRDFRARHLGDGGDQSERGVAFRRFLEAQGQALQTHAVFEALCEHFQAAKPRPSDWRNWPAAYRDPTSPSVAAFAQENRARVEYYAYLQWQAELQLAAVAERCRALNLPVGFYRDLAVGVAADGADAWAEQRQLVGRCSVGAPPDRFNPMGQDWGLPPYHPLALREDAYRAFVAVLRANMRHAGALRIDHVFGLMRLYWIPAGKTPSCGGYVRYPFEELLGVVALESQRNRCLVVGEDLGTLPDGLRDQLSQRSILSYRLLYFEQHADGHLAPPQDYPASAVVAVTTHDLPTLPGFWQGHDLTLRSDLGLWPSRELAREARTLRARDRTAIVDALRQERLWPTPDGPENAGLPELSTALVEAVYRFLGRTPSRLLMLHLEDVFGDVDQPNLPGTVDEHPNWRRKYSVEIEDILRDPRMLRVAGALCQRRAPDPEHIQ